MTSTHHDLADSPGASLTSTDVPLLVGAFFSFRIFVMLLAVRVLGTDPQAGTGISLALNYLCLLIVAFQTMGSGDRAPSRLLKRSSVRWVLFSLCFSGISLLWTVAASPFSALAYWCAMAADVATVALLLRTNNQRETIDALMKGYIWGACALALIAWLLPTQSDLRIGDEELLGANQIGYLCSFAFFFAQYLHREKVGKFGIEALLLGVTLLRTLSKTTIIAFFVAQAFLLVRDKSMSRRTKLSLVGAAAVILLLFSGLLTSYVSIYANTGNSPETLTGRLGIWAYIIEEGVKQPWIGHGFYSVWKVIPPFGEFEARHAHNELLQQFYLYGAMGIVMIAGLYGSFFLLVRRVASDSQKAFFYSLLVFVLVRGLADTEVYDFSLPLWSIVLFSLLLDRPDECPSESPAEHPPEMSLFATEWLPQAPSGGLPSSPE